jgi:hypothetical protein
MNVHMRIKRLEHLTSHCPTCGARLCCPACGDRSFNVADVREELARKIEAMLATREAQSGAEVPKASSS